jgi:hypothetical protein
MQKLLYENSRLRIFVLDNGRYRVEARDFVDPEEYVLYTMGETIEQAVARMQGRCTALRAKLDGLSSISCEKALDWSGRH